MRENAINYLILNIIPTDSRDEKKISPFFDEEEREEIALNNYFSDEKSFPVFTVSSIDQFLCPFEIFGTLDDDSQIASFPMPFSVDITGKTRPCGHQCHDEHLRPLYPGHERACRPKDR